MKLYTIWNLISYFFVNYIQNKCILIDFVYKNSMMKKMDFFVNMKKKLQLQYDMWSMLCHPPGTGQQFFSLQ
jgi:hypothetical protein